MKGEEPTVIFAGVALVLLAMWIAHIHSRVKTLEQAVQSTSRAPE